MENGIMKSLRERVLAEAERDGRFCPQSTEFHCVGSEKAQYTITIDPVNETDTFRRGASETKSKSSSSYSVPWKFQNDQTLRLAFQRTRPPHTSNQPDSLPFRNSDAARRIFDDLELPASYFQIADGSPATARSSVQRDENGKPARFEIVAYCLTKQGDWAMAISHNTASMSTSAFWSVDERIGSQALTDELKDFRAYASHPMLIPSIMLSAAFRMAVQRRHSIKERLSRLESTISTLRHPISPEEDPPGLDHLFELLQSCRKDQASRKGRYEFWDSFYAAIEAGFAYYSSLPDSDRKVHSDLHQWVTMTWQRLESLKARDKDHIHRVDNVSALLHNLVQQREIRLQSSIAKASQRDSKDMKFVALLGSIFLPASLVATILNVPQFQFAEGAILFGAYMRITLPFIALVVVLCMTRSYWVKWRVWRMRSVSIQRSEATEKDRLEFPRRSSTLATFA